jgi:hypothetical protein
VGAVAGIGLHIGPAPNFSADQPATGRFGITPCHRSHGYAQFPGEIPVRGQAGAMNQLTLFDIALQRIGQRDVAGAFEVVQVGQPPGSGGGP